MTGMQMATRRKTAGVTGGTDLGTETYTRGDAVPYGGTLYVAGATFNFNTGGTVTTSGNGTGSIDSGSSPYTNWNTNGGTYLSFELVSAVETGGPGQVSYTTSGLAASSEFGENRQQVSASAFALTVSSTFDSGLDPNFSTYAVTIKVSIWDAASGGNRKAYGIYTATAGP